MTLRKRRNGVMVREVGRETLILDTESNRIHQLNETASFIWRRCEDVESPEAIAAELAQEYDVNEWEALRDVKRTLDELQSHRLVSEVVA